MSKHAMHAIIKRRATWIILVAVVLTVGVGATVLKKQKQAPPPSLQNAADSVAALEFLPTDIAVVKPHDLRQLLALSGSLRAVNQSAVKARVSGDISEVLVREGEAVQAGQVLIKMDTREYQARLAQTKGSLSAAMGQLDIATKTRDNNKALLGKGFISQNAFDNALSQYDIAQANVVTARGALDVAQKAMADTVIRAPISGLISSRTVEPGEKVSADNRLLDIVDLRKMEMEAAVPTVDIMNVAVGQEVSVKVVGVPTPLTGKVVRINPSIQSGSRSILTYIQIDNPKGILRVGMFGEAQLTLAKQGGVLTIPQTAIHTDSGNTFVYAIENGKIIQKQVTSGLKGEDAEGSAVEIVKGLSDGEKIVKSNLGMLRNGTVVRVIQAVDLAGTPATTMDQ